MASEEKREQIIVKNKWHSGGWDGLYGLGIIGAAVYFLQQSAGFWPGVVAILKAFVWPAFVVYHLLALLKA